MAETTKFRVQAGALLFEIEGREPFVRKQMAKNSKYIQEILKEQTKIIKGGKAPVARATKGRVGRPPKKVAASGRSGRRPGRQPVIVRDSKLTVKPRALNNLKKALVALSNGKALGKDATVFAIAHYLCTVVLKKDNFTAGDIMAAHAQLGKLPLIPTPASIDVVQMLRNLAAESIGKEWVARNANGTFTLTAKGKKVAASGKIVRPRGRRAGVKTKAAKTAPKKAKRGRPRKTAAAGSKKSSTASKKGTRGGKTAVGRPRKSK